MLSVATNQIVMIIAMELSTVICNFNIVNKFTLVYHYGYSPDDNHLGKVDPFR